MRSRTHVALLSTLLFATSAWSGDLSEDLVKKATPLQLPADSPLTRSSIDPAAPDSNGLFVIRLGALTTRAFDDAFGRGAKTRVEVQRLVDWTNSALTKSGVPVLVELVDVQRYSQVDEYTDPYRILLVAAAEPRVQDWRDYYELDQVAILRNSEACNGLVGLASGFNNFEHSDPPESLSPDRDAYFMASMGPDVNGARCPDWLFAHEFAHNLSAGHGYAQHRADGIYWKTFAHGWRCTDAEGLSKKTIMGEGAPQANIPGMGTSGQVHQIFSSPELRLFAEPCGTEFDSGPEAAQANNVRAMSLAAPYVANYR